MKNKNKNKKNTHISMLIPNVIDSWQSFPIKLINDINTLNLNSCAYFFFLLHSTEFAFVNWLVAFVLNNVFTNYVCKYAYHFPLIIFMQWRRHRLPNSISKLPFNCYQWFKCFCFFLSFLFLSFVVPLHVSLLNVCMRSA